LALKVSSCKLLRRSRGEREPAGRPLSKSRRLRLSAESSWRHESPRNQPRIHQLARASPSAALSSAYADRENAHFGAIRELAARQHKHATDSRIRRMGQRSEGTVYISFAHCSVRLLEPVCGIPAVVKSQSASLQDTRIEGGREKRSEGNAHVCSALHRKSRKPRGPCWNESMSPS